MGVTTVGPGGCIRRNPIRWLAWLLASALLLEIMRASGLSERFVTIVNENPLIITLTLMCAIGIMIATDKFEEWIKKRRAEGEFG